jgi:hypothetical protein
MKMTVIGYMKSHLDQNNLAVNNEVMPEVLEDLKRFAGAEAGICYMSKPYFDSYVSDELKALNRFSTVASTGHHSVAGHSQVAVLFEGIPKIIAMYLNNLGCYETSEKSGRYTVMTGSSDLEMEIYHKWCRKLNEKIKEYYGTFIDDKTVDKLAKENARYHLSIFTPTTMGYTTSIRQWNYIIDWCEKFIETETPYNYFFTELKKYIMELGKCIKDVLYVEELRDIKNRFGLDMIEFDKTSLAEKRENFVKGKLYTYHYKGTFAQYAQAHRHRSLFYKITFDGKAKEFYIPPIIKGTELEKEWIEDMESLSYIIPTGTLIDIEEIGDVEKFFLKSMERNCGRAQLEIMTQNLETANFIYENRESLIDSVKERIEKYYIKSTPKMKGQMLRCKEPCIWTCMGSKERKI